MTEGGADVCEMRVLLDQRLNRIFEISSSLVFIIFQAADAANAHRSELQEISYTKPPLFQRNRLTCSGNPSFESCEEGKA